MKRGNFITVVTQGDFGNPRPALIIQADQFAELVTVTVLLVTSLINDAPLLRITVQPDTHNGLEKISQVIIDKIMTIKQEKIGNVIGIASDELMLAINRALIVFLGVG